MNASNETCPACGSTMLTSRGPFGFIREGIPLVIKDVERLECPMCHELSFTAEQSKALHKRRGSAVKLEG